MSTKMYTRTGDSMTTAMGCTRVSKSSLVCDAIGALDEYQAELMKLHSQILVTIGRKNLIKSVNNTLMLLAIPATVYAVMTVFDILRELFGTMIMSSIAYKLAVISLVIIEACVIATLQSVDERENRAQTRWHDDMLLLTASCSKDVHDIMAAVSGNGINITFAEAVDDIEKYIDGISNMLPAQKQFVIMFTSPEAVQANKVRTACRTAERAVASLSMFSSGNDVHSIARMINRMSSLWFVVARGFDHMDSQATICTNGLCINCAATGHVIGCPCDFYNIEEESGDKIILGSGDELTGEVDDEIDIEAAPIVTADDGKIPVEVTVTSIAVSDIVDSDSDSDSNSDDTNDISIIVNNNKELNNMIASMNNSTVTNEIPEPAIWTRGGFVSTSTASNIRSSESGNRIFESSVQISTHPALSVDDDSTTDLDFVDLDEKKKLD